MIEARPIGEQARIRKWLVIESIQKLVDILLEW